jgi:poly-gamma-glutamate synthesis protein (capsule biosynthesis protein)
VASIHWGSNWGYKIPSEQRAFAHELIDEAGVDIIHGHSSHHAKGIEIYRGKPILYGCGDFINDYEGIQGHRGYRGDLVLMYFPTINPATGRLVRLEMTPLQIKRFQLHRVSRKDAEWVRDTLAREGRELGTTVTLTHGNTLRVGSSKAT